jgi:hypothetical protein
MERHCRRSVDEESDGTAAAGLRSRAARPLAALFLVPALALVACGGGAGRLKPDTPPGVNLAGTWRLNRSASDDPQAMIERIRKEEMKRMRRASGPPPDELPEIDEHGNPRRVQHDDSERSASRMRFMPRLPYAEALGASLTAETLQIEQSPTRFVLVRGDDRRSFTPGGDSVVSVANGVADQHSGWSGKEYVIEVRPQVGARVIERYGLSADGRQLVEKVSLTDPGWPKLEFTRVYEPGTLAPRGLPTSN